MTRALLVWLLAAVLSLLAGILAALVWRVLATLEDAWDVAVDAERVNAERVNAGVNVSAFGGMLVTDAYTGKRARSVFGDDVAYRMAERMALPWPPGSPA